MRTTLPIEKILVLSTSHITKEVATELDRLVAAITNLGESVAMALHDTDWIPSWTRVEGWMFHVPKADANDSRYVNAPYCLQACVNMAREAGCDWLMLDRDGEVVPDLPTWEW